MVVTMLLHRGHAFWHVALVGVDNQTAYRTRGTGYRGICYQTRGHVPEGLPGGGNAAIRSTVRVMLAPQAVNEKRYSRSCRAAGCVL